MNKIISFLYFFYQIVVKFILAAFSIKTGPTCRFQPTCSEYSKESFKKYGFLKGLYKSTVRISKCHPLSKGGIDLP